MRLTYGTLILIAQAVTGCGAPADSHDVMAANGGVSRATPTFLAPGRAGDCPGGCLAQTETLARGALGLDPTDTGRTVIRNSDTLRSVLEEECQAAGGMLRSVRVADMLASLKEGPRKPPDVLVHESGYLCVLVGAIDIDGQLMGQLMHGQMAISLVTADQIVSAGFTEAWRLENRSSGVPVQVGNGKLRISETLHNFGEVKPHDHLEHTFYLTNEGSKTLVMGKPTTSCTCTMAGAAAGMQLQPGETQPLTLTVQSNNAASQKNSVVLPFFEQGSGAPKHVELLLLASQRQLMRLAPTDLDFGIVIPGERYTRSLRLNEVPTDRFALQAVDVGELPLSHEISRTTDSDGLNVYRVQLELEVDDVASGTRQGAIQLMTDSRFRPEVPIPVRFEVPPPVRAVPSVISLGTVAVGERHQERVRIESRDGERVRIEVQSVPGGCSVEIDEATNPPELIISIELTEAGVWRDKIRCRGEIASSYAEEIEVQCVAYVRNPT